MTLRSALILSLTSLLILTACGDDPEPKQEDPAQMKEERQEPLAQTAPFISDDKLETYMDVEWQEDLTLVEQDAMDALIRYDWAAQTYTFDAEAADQAGLRLESGRTLLLAGLALRRITSVDRSGGEITVETEHAALEDAIQDGELGFSYDTEFTNEMFEYSTMEFQMLTLRNGEARVSQPLKIDANNVSVSLNEDGTVTYEATIDQYTYKMDFSLEGDQFQAAFNVTKQTGGDTSIRYYLVGTVNAPNNRLDASFSSGELDNFDYKTSGLSGELELGIIAAGSGNDNITIEVPSPVFKYPILIGGVIPATVEIGAAVGLSATVPQGAQASAQIKNTYTFDSEMGFRLDGTQMKAQSGLGSINIENGNIDLAANFSPITATLNVGFPRIGISMLGNSASARVQPIYSLTGELSFGPVCQSATLGLQGNGEYNISAFGQIPIASGTTDFFKEQERVLQDSCEQ